MATPVSSPSHIQSIPTVKQQAPLLYMCTVRGCFALLAGTEALVPNLGWLYQRIRKTGIDGRRPLKETEFIQHIRCEECALRSAAGLKFNRQHGIHDFFTVAYTLEVLKRRMEQEVAKMLPNLLQFNSRKPTPSGNLQLLPRTPQPMTTTKRDTQREKKLRERAARQSAAAKLVNKKGPEPPKHGRRSH